STKFRTLRLISATSVVVESQPRTQRVANLNGVVGHCTEFVDRRHVGLDGQLIGVRLVASRQVLLRPRLVARVDTVLRHLAQARGARLAVAAQQLVETERRVVAERLLLGREQLTINLLLERAQHGTESELQPPENQLFDA